LLTAWRQLRLDGSTETRYPNGRVRIKDARGVVISDIKP
jgi:hypothetical protein